MKTFPVCELFCSVEGEGARTGAPAIFIRLFGCNLDCSYCDTTYACKNIDNANPYKWMTSEDIIQDISKYQPCRCVTLTGGEPLIHQGIGELIQKLRDAGYWVNIETNGAVDLEPIINSQTAKRSAMDYFFTMDWKSLSSGESDKMIASDLELLESTDVLKFVVGSREDLDQMKQLLEDNPEIDAQIYVSPVWGKIEPVDIVKYILDNQLVYVKVQVQLHKTIFDPMARGV